MVPNPVIGGGRRASSVSLHPLLAASLQFGSPTAEQFRALRTRIGQIEFGGRDCRSIVVTSPTPGDGKTVTSSNLALRMAQEFHRKVLLIDADLRKGALHRIFGVPARRACPTCWPATCRSRRRSSRSRSST